MPLTWSIDIQVIQGSGRQSSMSIHTVHVIDIGTGRLNVDLTPLLARQRNVLSKLISPQSATFCSIYGELHHLELSSLK